MSYSFQSMIPFNIKWRLPW